MIRNSFIFLERVGPSLEQNIWSQGISDWSSFISAPRIRGLSPVRKDYFSRQLAKARRSVFDYDSSFFTDCLPSSEVWRLYDHFRDDCLFLDIETTGYYGDISVITVFDGDSSHTLVKHHSLHRHNLKRVFSHAKLLVSFNGISFDVPVLRRAFRDVIPPVPHLDLRFPLARLGFTGGLKSIERDLGISRCASVDGVSGEDAVALWHDYRMTGDEDSLSRLVKYNEEDVINLKPIADFVYRRMSSDMKSALGI
ncbi:TPA: ribonuclease H-like domain-containing protein [Candidatus Woesearchaeota archaeon]|nr:ribonuclease H-like domain-containing protein [Candidatus Woesearchaeota archaeon]